MQKSRIYEPRLSISADTAEFLSFLSSQLHEFLFRQSHNAPSTEIVFSPRESFALERGVGNVLDDRNLFHSLYFVENLVSNGGATEDDLKEIYLQQRKRFGYDRALSSARWHEYVTRLGMRKGSLSTYLRGAEMMTFDHFIRMEKKLFSIQNISSDVSDFAISLIQKNRAQVDEIRSTSFNDRSQAPRLGFVSRVKSSLNSIRESNSMPPEKLAALMVVITNSTSLFSSRDWSVAGTISTMAGGITMAIYSD
jgi:hypothetical protein